MKIQNGVLTELTTKDVVNGTITVPEGVKEISSLAFFFLRNNKDHDFKKLVLPGSLQKVVKNEVFANKDLQELVLSEGITEISESAFAFSKFKTIKLPETLKVISDFAFRNANIAKIDLPNGLTHIGLGAFELSSNLKSIQLSQSLEYLGNKAFHLASSLKSVVFSADSPVKKVLAETFAGTDIERIVLSNNIKKFEYYSNSRSSKLKVLELNQGLEDVSIRLPLNKGIRKIEVPSSVRKGAFNFGYPYELHIGLPDGNVYDLKVVGGRGANIYSGYENVLAVTTNNGQNYIIDGSKVIKLSEHEGYLVKGFSEIVQRAKLDHYYVWMSKLKEIYGGEIKNYPTAMEVLNVPIDKVQNFAKNRKLFNEINKSFKYKTSTRTIEESILRILLDLGLLDLDAGVKNKVITFAREHLLNDEVFSDIYSVPLVEGKQEYAYNAKKFNMAQSIMKEDVLLGEKLSAIVGGLKNYEELIKFKTTITSKDVMEFMAVKEFGGKAESNKELARIASVAGVDGEEFNKLLKMVNRSKKSKVHGFLTYLQNKTEEVKIKQQSLSDSILDKAKASFDFEWLTKDDNYSAMLGYICDSCAVIDGDAHDLLRASISPNYPVQNLVVKNKNGSIIGKGTAYLDINKGVIMFNNIELGWNFEKKSTSSERVSVLQAFKRGIDAMVETYNRAVEGTNVAKITKAYMGLSNNDLSDEIRNEYNEVPYEEIYKDAKFGGYKTDTLDQYDLYPEGKDK